MGSLSMMTPSMSKITALMIRIMPPIGDLIKLSLGEAGFFRFASGFFIVSAVSSLDVFPIED